MSIESVEIHSKYDHMKKQLQKWIEISSFSSDFKNYTIKFKELLNECMRKDDVITDLDKQICQLKSNEEHFVTLIKDLQKSKHNSLYRRSKNLVSPEKERKSPINHDSSDESCSLYSNQAEGYINPLYY